MSAPVWEAKGTLLESTTATPSFAVPSGTVADDIVTVSFFLDGGTATVTGVPAGFQECENSPVGFSGVAGAHSLQSFWKRTTGTDAGTYDFTLSGSTFVAGYSERFSGCIKSGSPWESNPDTAQETVSSTVDTPAVNITTQGVDRLVVWRATSWSGGSWTPPTGFTERHDGSIGVLTSATKEQASVGSTGDVIGTVSIPDKHNVWMGALVGVAVVANLSIADEARANMLAALSQAESNKSNVDLMREVVAAGGLSLITVTDASAAVHYWRYLKIVRDS